MKLTILCLAIGLLPTIAAAQQQTPNEQALSAKLSQEISAGLGCSATLITNKQMLEIAQARIKELEDKYEPKK